MHDHGIKKLYYSISEVSEMTALDAHVLRYWQGEFAELAPRKNRAGRRIYTDEDIAVVQRIKHLLREEKYTIEGARQVLAREAAQDEDVALRRRALLELRAYLQQMLAQLPGREDGASK